MNQVKLALAARAAEIFQGGTLYHLCLLDANAAVVHDPPDHEGRKHPKGAESMWFTKLCLFRALVVAILEKHLPQWFKWSVIGYCAVTLWLIGHFFYSIHLSEYVRPLLKYFGTTQFLDLNLRAVIIAAYLLLVAFFGWQVRKLKRWAWVQLDKRG